MIYQHMISHWICAGVFASAMFFASGGANAACTIAECAQPDNPSPMAAPTGPSRPLTPDEKECLQANFGTAMAGDAVDFAYGYETCVLSKQQSASPPADDDEHLFSPETDQFLENFNRNNEASENPWESGDAGYAIGCAADAIFQPEAGGCLENPINRSAYDAARNMHGDGVLAAPDYSQYLPLPDGTQDAGSQPPSSDGDIDFNAYLPSP